MTTTQIMLDARWNTEDQHNTVVTKLTSLVPLNILSCLMTPMGVMQVEECEAELRENGSIECVFWIEGEYLMWYY